MRSPCCYLRYKTSLESDLPEFSLPRFHTRSMFSPCSVETICLHEGYIRTGQSSIMDWIQRTHPTSIHYNSSNTVVTLMRDLHNAAHNGPKLSVVSQNRYIKHTCIEYCFAKYSLPPPHTHTHTHTHTHAHTSTCKQIYGTFPGCIIDLIVNGVTFFLFSHARPWDSNLTEPSSGYIMNM